MWMRMCITFWIISEKENIGNYIYDLSLIYLL